jgi:hypothetical protein
MDAWLTLCFQNTASFPLVEEERNEMAGWIRDSLSETMDSLKDVGMTSLADDMRRILESGEVDNLRVFRSAASEGLSGTIRSVDDTEGFVRQLRAVAKAFNLADLTVHVVNSMASTSFDPMVMTTYSGDWINQYVAQKYSLIDPVLAMAQTSDDGFFWDGFVSSPPFVLRFLDDAAAHGIGPAGFTLPIDVWHSTRIAVTATSKLSPKDFRQQFSFHRSDFELISREIVDTFADLAAQEYASDRRPSELMLRVLRGLSRGLTLRELASEFRISSFEDVATQICEFYEARTLYQAIAVCTRLHHLEGLPLDNSDIASDSFPPTGTRATDMSSLEETPAQRVGVPASSKARPDGLADAPTTTGSRPAEESPMP